MNIAIIVLLLLAGIVLLLVELFLLPGFGISGICSLLCLAGAVIWSYWKLAPIYPWAGHLTLIAAVISVGLGIYLFLKSHALDKMSLDTKIDSSVSLAEPGEKMHLKEENNAEKKIINK